MNSQVWIEVSINIGKKCLIIEIQRNQCIEDVVNRFISTNKLSTKYEPIITSMIKQQIQKRIENEEKETKALIKTDKINKNQSNSVISSTSSQSEQGFNQSGIFNKDNGLMSQVIRIQQQTNRKRTQRLAQLKQSSISKMQATPQQNDSEIQRPSMRKTERSHQSFNNTLQLTPKMATDNSRQFSNQTLNSESERSYLNNEQYNNISQNISNNLSNNLSNNISNNMSNDYSSNGSSRQNIEYTDRQKSRVITQNIAELKQLLSNNQQYNTHHKSEEDSSIWNETKNLQKHYNERQSKTKRVKTETAENIYEKWKKLEEKKRVESTNNKTQEMNKVQPKSKSPLVKREDNFFYNKGKSFLEEKSKKIQTKFNEIYPFKTSKTPLSAKTGIETSTRLFKQSKQYFSKKCVKPKHVDLDLSLKPDPIREKVRKRDQEHDQILSQLIKEGRVRSPATIQYKSKSPFRKTMIFN